MNWYVKVLKQYVDFSGRARRTEYWMFTLFNVIISIVLAAVDGLLFGTGSFAASSAAGSVGFSASLGTLGTIYALAVLLPGLGAAVRRLHDTDRSGWWVLIALIPIVGGIVLIVFLATAGNSGPNRHGADPKALASGAAY
jgi:uncharacterized membrane protein YhaH (DUF805 family)